MRASDGTLVFARPRDNRRRAGIVALALLVGALVGCGRRTPEQPRRAAIPVDVFADTGRAGVLEVVPPVEKPTASVWMERVSQVRIANRAAGAAQTPPPDAAPETLASEPSAPRGLAVDEDLKPPLLRERGTLIVPPRAPRETVELDVRVDEEGRVSDALWAAGSEDSTLVRAASECALAMRFFPALQSGRPVAVWCRQRFDFGRPAPRE